MGVKNISKIILKLVPIGFIFMSLFGCGASKSHPVTASPKAVFFCNKSANTQTTYVLSKEKVNKLGKVLSANPQIDPANKNGCNGWWINFNSKNVEILKIPEVNVNKEVAVKINNSYVKAVSKNH